ncbi:MAG: porin [Rubrivivax sp.]|nr:porin [Rubrivivax sp.]
MHLQSPAALTAFACLALASTACVAQTVTIYGRIATTANQIETGSTTKLRELRDNASRLGFRGVEDLGGGLRAMFGLEMGLSIDTGNLTNPTFRNSYVALRGGLGTVALGRLDSANPTGSPLYSQVTALTHFAPNDAGATAISAAMLNPRNRTSNSIGYMSPTWSGINLRARYYLRGTGTATDPEDAARSMDLGLNYQAGSLKAAVGYGKDSRRGGLANNEFEDKWQAGLNYAVLKGLEVYLLGGVDRYKNTSTRRRDVQYTQLGTSYTMGPHKVVFNLAEREVQSSLTGDRKRTQLSYQYFISKRTDLQAFIDNDGIDSSRSNVRVRAIGAGVRHNF